MMKESSVQNETKKRKNQTYGICTTHVRDSDNENDVPIGQYNMKKQNDAHRSDRIC